MKRRGKYGKSEIKIEVKTMNVTYSSCERNIFY